MKRWKLAIGVVSLLGLWCTTSASYGEASVSKVVFKELESAQQRIALGDAEARQALADLSELQTRRRLNSYERANVWNTIAYAHYSLNELDAALGVYRKMLALDELPTSLRQSTTWTVAQLHLARNEYADALEQISELEKVGGSLELNQRYFKAFALLQLEKDTAAVAEIDAIRRSARSTDVGIELKWLKLQQLALYRLQRHEDLVDVYEEMIKISPERAYFLGMANSLMAIDEDQRAFEVWRDAYQRGLAATESDLEFLASIASSLGEDGYALSVLETGLRKGVLKPTAAVLKRVAYAQHSLASETGEIEVAIKAWREYLYRHPDAVADVDVRFLAGLYVQQGLASGSEQESIQAITKLRQQFGTDGLEQMISRLSPDTPVTEPSKGIQIGAVEKAPEPVGYKGSYALLIGQSDYSNGWPDLQAIATELDDVERMLRRQGFEVVRQNNLTGNLLRRAFRDFIDEFGYEPDNRLLFYFSGHGYTRDDGRKGYLVAADAPTPLKDEREFLRRSLSMGSVLSMARDMEARHAMFLFDSCFSGTIFKTRALADASPAITRLTSEPVRLFITAGDAGEEVPANSVFSPAFVDAVEHGLGDLNKDGYITGTELGLFLQDRVSRFVAQTPQFGKINDYELSRGDFVFRVEH